MHIFRKLWGTIEMIYPVTLDALGANPKSISLVMTSLSANSCSALGTFTWSELHN